MIHFRRFHLIPVIFIIFALAIPGFSQFPNLGYLTGTVSADGVGIEMTLLRLSNQDTSFVSISGADGNYAFVAPPGTYTVSNVDTMNYWHFTSEEVQIIKSFQPTLLDISLTNRPQDAKITGLVTFKGTPMAGVTVYFLKLGPEGTDFEDLETGNFNMADLMLVPYKAVTDSEGKFEQPVLSGSYFMHIPGDDNEGYLPYWNIDVSVGKDKTLDLGEIKLQEFKRVTGMVTNFSEFDFVVIWAYSVNSGKPFMANIFPTNDDGSYELKVAPDTYIFRAEGFMQELNHVYTVFYDGVFTTKEAAQIDVFDDVSGIDFVLPTSADLKPVTITGTVSSATSGKPLMDATVDFFTANFLNYVFNTYEAKTDADGNYSISAHTFMNRDSLIAFSYKDGFFAKFYDDQPTYHTADPIIIEPDGTEKYTVSGIDFALDSIDTDIGYKISGKVIDDEGNPVYRAQVTAYSTAPSAGVVYTHADSLGNYDFSSIFVEGSYVVLQAWAGYGYVPVIYDGKTSWEDADTLRMTEDKVANFTLKKAKLRIPFGQITGIVSVNSTNKTTASSIEGATIYLKKSGTIEWTNAAYVKADGSFDLPVESYGIYDLKLTSQNYQDVTKNNIEINEQTGNSVKVDFNLQVTSVGDNPLQGVIRTSVLHNAYPNPFNPSTTIRIDMVKTERVTLTVYNILGQKVRLLYSGILENGTRNFVWDGRDDSSKLVSSGLYFYQFKSDNLVQTRSMMLLK
ncbi:MAG: T9SS type A sorting domain-containing protein [Calditrichaceae bacterium]